MKKDYQKKAACATMPVLPQAVTVALAELAGDVQEGLLAMAVGTGLQVMAAMMSVDVEAACGPKGKHGPARTAVRHGRGDGSVTLGGRRVPVTRSRMRAADGTGELPVARPRPVAGSSLGSSFAPSGPIQGPGEPSAHLADAKIPCGIFASHGEPEGL